MTDPLNIDAQILRLAEKWKTNGVTLPDGHYLFEKGELIAFVRAATPLLGTITPQVAILLREEARQRTQLEVNQAGRLEATPWPKTITFQSEDEQRAFIRDEIAGYWDSWELRVAPKPTVTFTFPSGVVSRKFLDTLGIGGTTKRTRRPEDRPIMGEAMDLLDDAYKAYVASGFVSAVNLSDAERRAIQDKDDEYSLDQWNGPATKRED